MRKGPLIVAKGRIQHLPLAIIAHIPQRVAGELPCPLLKIAQIGVGRSLDHIKFIDDRKGRAQPR